MIMKLQGWVLPFGCLLALVAGGPCSGQAPAQVPAARPARAIDATVLKGVALDRDRQPEAADGVTRIADVIYGRKFGMALTMDVLRPRQPNQAAVVWAVSGGFKSDHDRDQIVRIEQATVMVDKLKEAGVAARLVVKEGAGHGWPEQDQDLKLFADWYDEHLRNSVGKARP